MLTQTQTAEIILFAAESGRIFVQEHNEVLDPAHTDWDGAAWADARDKLPWVATLLPDTAHAAWDLYQRTLVTETERLVDSPWRFYCGAETRQGDAITGKPVAPDAWFCEPKDYEGDTVYSPPFPTRAAAEAWADAQPDDD